MGVLTGKDIFVKVNVVIYSILLIIITLMYVRMNSFDIELEQAKREKNALSDTLVKDGDNYQKDAIPGFSSNNQVLKDSIKILLDQLDLKESEVFTLNQNILKMGQANTSGVITDTVYLNANVIRFRFNEPMNKWLSFYGHFDSDGAFDFNYKTEPIKITTAFKLEDDRLRTIINVSHDIELIESTSFYDLKDVINRERSWKITPLIGFKNSFGVTATYKRINLGWFDGQLIGGYSF